MKTRSEVVDRLVGRAGEGDTFRARLLADRKPAIHDGIGVAIPEGCRVEAHEDGANDGHPVPPPAGRLSEVELGAVAGGCIRGHETGRLTT